MTMLPGLVPIGLFTPLSVGGFSLTFLGSAVEPTGATTYSFTSQPFGDEAADRYIIVTTSTNKNRTLTAASSTIGGVTVTKIIELVPAEAGIALLIAAVPTGATGTVSLTFNGTSDNCGVGLWRLSGAATPTTPTTATDTVATGNDLSASLAIPAGGGGIGIVRAGGAAALTYIWTDMTEDFDQTVESPSSHSGARSLIAGTLTRTVTASSTMTASTFGLILAAWGP